MDDSYLIFLGILIVIFFLVNSRSKSSKLIKQAELAQREGRTLQAADLFIKAKRFPQAASIALSLPEIPRTTVLQKISTVISSSKHRILFTRLGDSFAGTEEFVKAATAFELADNSIKAARYYVLADLSLVKQGIQLVSEFSRNQRLNTERELRTLARFAFQNEKYLETAEILEFIGASDEADAVLAYAGEEYKRSEQVEGAVEAYTRLGRDSEAAELTIKLAYQLIEQNQLDKAFDQFKKALELSTELNITQNIKNTEKAMLATSQLVKARQHLRDNQFKSAADLYEKALTTFSGTLPAPLLAEAALAHEKSRDYKRASVLYTQAAKKVPKKKTAERFRKKARELKDKPEIKPLPTDKTTEAELRCIVCLRSFKDSDKVVRCPHCHATAHYAHFAEWIKMNGKCPVCKRRLKRVELIQ